MQQRVDIHHHMLPRAWIDEAKPHKPDQTWPPYVMNWTPQGSVEQMDEHGIAVAITELGLPGVWWASPADARRLARLCNEHAAQMARDFPGRFGMFATVPLPDVEGTLAEIAYALDVLDADGIGFLTSYGDVWAGDPRFALVYEELNRRRAVVHLHPTVPNRCIDIIPGIRAATQEYLFDTARAITNMLFTGTPARYPEIRWIFSHGGGAFPPLANRVTGILSHADPAARAALDAQLRTFYFDVATAVNAPSFAGLRALTSTDRMLLGTDYPYVDPAETVPELDRLDLTAEESYAINTGNALRLFPRVRRIIAPHAGSVPA